MKKNKHIIKLAFNLLLTPFQPAHDVRTTLYELWYDVKMLKWYAHTTSLWRRVPAGIGLNFRNLSPYNNTMVGQKACSAAARK